MSIVYFILRLIKWTLKIPWAVVIMLLIYPLYLCANDGEADDLLADTWRLPR